MEHHKVTDSAVQLLSEAAERLVSHLKKEYHDVLQFNAKSFF